MEYRNIRGTGIQVSRFCLGTMTFGDQTDEATSIRMVDRCLDEGVNFIDTADIYSKGVSEEITGKALKGKRDRVVLASKVFNFVGEDRHRDSGLHRWHIMRGVEASLRRLQTDCLDILYLHQPDRSTPIEETLEACDLLVRQGKVLYIGLSNFASWRMCEALWKAESHRLLSKPVVMQVPYNPITRSLDEECVAFSQQMNFGMVVYNPLAGGLLTGKHHREAPLEGTRFERSEMYYNRYWNERNFRAVQQLEELAAKLGISMVDLSIRWCYSHDFVDAVIFGASKMHQLEQNLRIPSTPLDAETLQTCDQIWAELRGQHFKYNR
jgi:aryl-alcohol dehydrogenase-like predicted oxidoreductase